MALTRLLPVLALILFAVGRILGELAVLGESYQFATNETCGDGADETKLIRGLETDNTFTPVAKLVGGVWTPEDSYKDRIQHISPSALILKHLKFNDAGHYEFTCGHNFIKLKVVIPLDIDVTLGETVNLPCFFFTAGVSIKSVKWTLNGSLVLEQDRSTERTSRAPRFERASLAHDWHLTGDLSLHLERVQLEDQGEFVCHIMVEEEKRGSPESVKLRVHHSHQDICVQQPEGSATPGAPVERPMGAGTVISISLNVVLLTVVIFLIFWLRSRRPAAAGGGQDRQGTGEEQETVIGNCQN